MQEATIQLSGDLDYYTKWLGLPNSTTKAEPCGLCRCTYAGSNSWLDNRQVAPWRSSLLSNTDWTTWWSTTCPLLQLPRFSALSFAYDLMHCLYLGALQYIYGSVFFLLAHDCLNLEPLANLKTVWQFIQDIQKEDATRHRYRHRLDKLSMFVKKGYPKLKGKAADIKGLDLAMQKCWLIFMDTSLVQHIQIAALLQLNLEIGTLLDSSSPKFGFMAVPPVQRHILVEKSLQMTQLHVELSEHYQGQNRALFNVTTKFHFCAHIITYQLANTVHPFVTWCFKGESMMKSMQKKSKVAFQATNIGM